jgi:hypothetical protein
VLIPTLAIFAAHVAGIAAATSRSASLSLGSTGILKRDGYVPLTRRWRSRRQVLQWRLPLVRRVFASS